MLSRRFFLCNAAATAFTACQRPGERVIGVVPKATSHLFFVSVHEGVKKAAQDYRVRVLWNGPNDETDHNRQIQIVDAMIAQRVDGLAISATDERALAAPIERAIRAGIPVALFDSGANIDNYISFIATDNYGAGRDAARRLAALTGARSKIAMIMQKPGGTSTGLREQGFEETMKKEFPDRVIAARQYGMADAAKSRAAAENILTAHPDLAGMFASSEASSLGAIQAIKSRGLSGKLRLITFDFSDSHIEALKDGTIDVMLVQDPFRLGYEAVKSVAQKLQGETPARRLDIPALAVRKEDLNKPEVRAILTSRRPET